SIPECFTAELKGIPNWKPRYVERSAPDNKGGKTRTAKNRLFSVRAFFMAILLHAKYFVLAHSASNGTLRWSKGGVPITDLAQKSEEWAKVSSHHNGKSNYVPCQHRHGYPRRPGILAIC